MNTLESGAVPPVSGLALSRPVRLAAGLHLLLTLAGSAATVTMTGGKTAADCRHDGGLRPVVGVQEHALFRPTCHPQAKAMEGHAVAATRFNHHPFLTFWKGRFWAYYIGFQVDESTKSGYLQWSVDGRNWNDGDKATLFPAPLATHQRTAFFVASNDRLIATTWHSRNGEAGRGGVGSRLVREIRGPGDFGPIHVLKDNARGGSPGVEFPRYSASPDSGFRRACEELLADSLQMQQMWEEDEDRAPGTPYVIHGDGTHAPFSAKGFSWYRLEGPDGPVVANWKGGWIGISRSGKWSKGEVVRDESLNRFNEHRSAKMWGEPRAGGGYAMFYCLGSQGLPGVQPSYGWDSRTPLAVATSGDGFAYAGEPLCVSGDSGPQLYGNAKVDNKTTGASYVQGITWIANRENKPRYNENLWITYSTNKEYIWVTEVPKEIAATVDRHVDEKFAAWKPGDRVGQWNIRNGGWTPVRLVADRGTTVLRLQDQDPYDYAKAFRVIPASSQLTVNTTVRPKQTAAGELHVELVDATGKRPVRLRFGGDGALQHQDAAGNWQRLATYAANEPVELTITLDAAAAQWSVFKDGAPLATKLPTVEAVVSVERVEYRTGAWRLDDFSTNMFGKGTPGARTTELPNAHEAVTRAEFDLTGLRTQAGIVPPAGDKAGASRSLRILCVGDSITVGAGVTDGGYRSRLQALLAGGGFEFDFVGRQSQNSAGMGDPEHEGHGGKRTDQIDVLIGPALASHRASLYLVHVGTNDASEYQRYEARLRAMLDRIFTATPDAHVILAKIINRKDQGRLLEYDAMRARIEPIVTDYRLAGRAITWVDQNTLGHEDFPAKDLFHPNASGYQKMAGTWYDGILKAVAADRVR
jgi:lysophospholipase L1-like esterase